MRLLAGSVYVTSRWAHDAKNSASSPSGRSSSPLWWLTLAFGRQNRQPLVRSGLLLIVAFGISLTLAASGAITLGELGGVAAATLFGTTAVAWLTGTLADGPSNAAGPLAIMLGSLIFLGYYYASSRSPTPPCSTLSLAASAGWLPSHWERAG